MGRSEEEIDELPKKSKTATFFATVTEFDLDRWEGVPFVLSVGKDLPERYARVKYHLRNEEQVTIYIQGRFTGPAVLSTAGSTKQTKNKDHKPEADMPFIYGITNSSDTIPTEHLTDTTGMVKQIYGKDYEPDTDYEHPSNRKPKVVEKPKEKKKDDTPKPVMNKLKKKTEKPKADDKEAEVDADEDHLEL